MSRQAADSVLGDNLTLPDLLLARKASDTDSVRFITDEKKGFVERASDADVATRAQLFVEARQTGGALRDLGVIPGDPVVLMASRPRDFLRCFFACQLVGAIPVPLVPPWSLARMKSHVARITKIVELCSPRLTIADEDVVAAIRAFSSSELVLPAFGQLSSPGRLKSDSPLESFHRPDPEDTALVQFTSGSTSDPRGVELSHRALLSNCVAIGASLGFDEPGHLGCAWLPLFHDMGLIGHVLVPLVWQIPTILMPPESFAVRPISWLEAVSGFGATISTAPNFAYQLAATRLAEEKTADLDLSRWKVALCGGEPVLPESLREFAQRFEPNGFHRKSLCPVYGLAEATLAVSLSDPHQEVRTEKVDRNRFSTEGVAELDNAKGALEFVSCGRAPWRHQVQIRDATGLACSDGTEGDIWTTGPSLMKGYLQNSESTGASLREGWLLTGDRGYLREGELFVTGRSKELIVKGGRNLYPQEIEASVHAVEGIRAGRVAAFAVPDAEEGTDRLLIAAELRKGVEASVELERKVFQAASSSVGIRPDEVVLLPPNTLTKTSSGKMQRLEAQRRYLENALERPQARFRDAARLLLERARLRLRF